MHAKNGRRLPVNLPEHFLVTGGAGFIGSYLVESLLADGKAVTVIDDLSTGSLDNLQAVISNPNLRVIESKVSECRALSEMLPNQSRFFISPPRWGGTGGKLADPDDSNQLARNGSRPGSRQQIWSADPADLHFGGLWQEPKAGIFRRRRLADRPSASGAVELCLLEVDGRVSGDGLCAGKKIARDCGALV